jgi:hypothetical protein
MSGLALIGEGREQHGPDMVYAALAVDVLGRVRHRAAPFDAVGVRKSEDAEKQLR